MSNRAPAPSSSKLETVAAPFPSFKAKLHASFHSLQAVAEHPHPLCYLHGKSTYSSSQPQKSPSSFQPKQTHSLFFSPNRKKKPTAALPHRLSLPRDFIACCSSHNLFRFSHIREDLQPAKSFARPTSKLYYAETSSPSPLISIPRHHLLFFSFLQPQHLLPLKPKKMKPSSSSSPQTETSFTLFLHRNHTAASHFFFKRLPCVLTSNRELHFIFFSPNRDSRKTPLLQPSSTTCSVFSTSSPPLPSSSRNSTLFFLPPNPEATKAELHACSPRQNSRNLLLFFLAETAFFFL